MVLLTLRMTIRFLILEWKSFFRSASVGKGIALKLLTGFLALYFALTFLFIGTQLYAIIVELFPGEEPMAFVNRYLLLWLLSELVMRFLLQTLSVVHVKPFLVQQIKKSTLIHYLLGKSVFSFYNLLAPLVFIPFAIVCFRSGDFSAIQLTAWVVAVLSMTLTINFLNFIVQKRFAEELKALLPFIAICLVLALLEYFGVFYISIYFGQAFDQILLHPYLALIPLVLSIIVYRSNFKTLIQDLYLDHALKNDSKGLKEGTDLSWMKRFGAVNPFLQLDMRLLWRNKRAKATLSMSLIFLFYGLIFYTNDSYEGSSLLAFVGIFTTGVFLISFGQFIPAWDSGYYSLLMSQNIPMRLYLESKIILMYISVLILTVLTVPYVYFGWHILALNVACAIYNVGVNVPVILYFGSMNKKRIDLDKGQFFNYQGVGAAQWLVGIPLYLIPILIWALVSTIFDQGTATIVIGVIGLCGILLKNAIMPVVVRAYQTRKYGMIEGFKQKD